MRVHYEKLKEFIAEHKDKDGAEVRIRVNVVPINDGAADVFIVLTTLGFDECVGAVLFRAEEFFGKEYGTQTKMQQEAVDWIEELKETHEQWKVFAGEFVL